MSKVKPILNSADLRLLEKRFLTRSKADMSFLRRELGKNFVTRSDKDYQAIRELIITTMDKTIDAKIDEKFRHLPTKDECFTAMDKMMSELRDIRLEIKAHNIQIERNNDRLEKMESIHPAYSH